MAFAEGQSDSIVEDIENMVRSYVEKVSFLTLASCYMIFDAKMYMTQSKVFLQ